MKNKVKPAFVIVLCVIVATIGLAASVKALQTTYTQNQQIIESTVIAERNEVNVTVGDKTVMIVAYNIDGYNYFRAADLCQVLNMKVFRYMNDMGDGIKIVSDKGFDGSVEPPPADNDPVVMIEDINVYYDTGYVRAKSFNLADRYYIKLADIEAAANRSYEIKHQAALEQAQQGVGQAITMRATTINFKTSYDSGTNTITIATTETDFQKLYEELYEKEQGQSPSGTEKVETLSKAEAAPKAEAQPKLTHAPGVGEIPSKILKDESQPAYVDGKVNLENYTTPYAKSLVGECTWYAKGRFEEITGISYPYGVSIYDIEKINKNELLKVINDPYLIEARSIAVFGYVHVLFVEYVEHDVQGIPTYIYFTEGNTGHDSVYRPGQDGKVQKLEFNDFVNRQDIYKGCIVIK